MRRLNLRREEGVAMAEFALIAPAFLLLALGIITFGFIFYYWNAANHAANETARWAAVDQNPYAPAGATPPGAGGETLQQHVHDSFPGNDANVCITTEDGTPAEGEYLTVKVQKPFGLTFKLPLIPALDMRVTIRGTSTMRIENVTSTAAYATGDNIGTCT